MILASREALRYQNDLHALQNGAVDDFLEPLERPDSDGLLAALGVPDPAFQQAVFERLAHGHPLITRMAGQAWLAAPKGIPAARIPEFSAPQPAIEWVQDRILERLAEPLQSAVRWAALLRWFNAEELNQILVIELSEADFLRLTRYAFMIHLARRRRPGLATTCCVGCNATYCGEIFPKKPGSATGGRWNITWIKTGWMKRFITT